MERDLRKRENRAKNRAHGRGRGGFHQQPKREKQKLESNDWRFEEVTEETENMLLRKSTVDACSRQQPAVSIVPKSSLPEDEVEKMNEILSKLSLEDQLSNEYIVPVPKLSAVIKTEPVKVEKKQDAPKPEEKPASQKPDLDAWLNGLLG